MDDTEAISRPWLKHWHDLVDPEGPEWIDEFSAGGMINDLAADRDRLAACLAPLPRAEALTARINEIIDAAFGGSPASAGLYFVVEKPYPATNEELQAWTAQFYRRCQELTGAPEAMPSIELRRCEKPVSAFLDDVKDSDNGPRRALADWLGDTVSAYCTPEEQAAYSVLDEALYKMACDYLLADYVRWMFVEERAPGPNPFRAQLDLWRSGARERFRPGEGVTIFAPLSGAG